MTGEEPGGVNLEKVMFRLMEYQPGENNDKTDTMVMISLINLLGIISVMNKQSLPAGSSRSAGEDPLMPMLMGLLAQNQQPSRGGGPGINPALLMSLMGSKGQRPENALLLGLLSSMMQPPPGPPQPPPGWEKDRDREWGKESSYRSGDRENNPAPGGKEVDKQDRNLSWDRRLG
jgi:hypothetical protein